MNHKEYRDWSNQQKPSKKNRWLIISLSIVVIVLLGFLTWVYWFVPEIEGAYLEGQKDLVIFQTDNQVMLYFDQDGKIQRDRLVDICQAFTGVQQ